MNLKISESPRRHASKDDVVLGVVTVDHRFILDV